MGLVTLLTGNRGAPSTGGEEYNCQVAAELAAQGHRLHWLHVYTLAACTGIGLLPGVGPWLGGLVLAPLALLPGLLVEDEHASAHLFWANRLRRSPAVMVVHHLDGDFTSPWGRCLRRWRLGGADLVVAVSQATQRDVVGLGIPAQRVRVVPPGFEPAGLPRDAPRDSAGPLRVLAVGNCTERKGFVTLLQALELLAPDTVCARVLGGTDEPHYRRVLRPWKRDDCFFEGRVARERLLEAYAWADLLVLPSLREGWSIVASEALYCGLPVVASDLACLAGRVVPGETGWLFPPGDARALAHWLGQATREELLRMGRAARELVREEHGWTATRRAFLEVVREVWS